MIKITDITLSNMNMRNADPSLIKEFYCLLLNCGVDFVEVNPDTLELIGDCIDTSRTVLKFDEIPHVDFEQYKNYKRYISRYSGFDVPKQMEYEIHINDIRELNQLEKYTNCKNIRLTGLDDFILYDHMSAFARIKNSFFGKIELCPQNQYYFATALAVEWLSSGGQYAASSFLGIGDYAATEEILMALRVNNGHKPGADLSVLRRLKTLAAEITGCTADPHKPIVGDRIFHVESGIHVDGIMKNAANFEPFPPETVGAKRKIVLGKHSGKSSILMKLKKYNILPANTEMVICLLRKVKKLSIRLGRSISDDEFLSLVEQYLESEKGGS